jgi:hypothetical protein
MILPKKKKQPTKVFGERAPSDIKLGFDLSEKQKQIYDWCEIGNGIQYVAASTGRQVGKTTTGSVVCVGWSLGAPNYKTGFFLPTYKQCKKVFNGVKRMLTPLHKYISFNQSDYTITFWNGSMVQFFTADNDNCRGFTFDAIILDEACFIKSDIWEEAIEPTVAVSLSKKDEFGRVGYSGKVLLTSTPKTRNWFFGMVQAGNDERARVTRFTSLEGGIIAKEILDRIKARIPETAFRNEYLGEFLDSGNGLFKYNECLIPLSKYSALPKRGAVAGLDIGAKDDYLVLTILDKLGRVIFIGRWRHLDYPSLMAIVAAKLRAHGSPVCVVETNGVGQAPYDMLKSIYGRVKSWTTTNKSKSDIVGNLQIKFNLGEVKIPDLEYLKNELDFFTCEWKDGKPKYSGSNGFHDDCVMSLAIAAYHLGKIRTFAMKELQIEDDQYNQNQTNY